MFRFTMTLALFAAVSLAASATAQTAQTTTPPPTPAAAPFVMPPPPGRLIDIGGRKLHLLCKGTGEGPTVIFEAGLSQFTANSTYGKAQDAIAPFARVCTYDRAGLGWSDPGPLPRTHQAMVEDLHRLLIAAKIKPPYVLVGHSMGGPLARLYANTYPGSVVGMVLLDSSSEDQFDAETALRASIVGQIDAGLRNAKPGVPVVPLPPGTPPEVAMTALPEILATVKEEELAIDRVPAELKRLGGYGRLGNMPLVVVRRGKVPQPETEVEKNWRLQQEQLARLSSNSILIVAHNSGHVIPYDEPEVAADAVKRVLESQRTGAPLQ